MAQKLSAFNILHRREQKVDWRLSIFLPFLAAFSVLFGSAVHADEKLNKLFSIFVSPETCRGKIDWYAQGLSDGQVGWESSYFRVYQRNCSRRSRTPDEKAYFRGYEIGIRSYCDPENIYQLARTGAVAISACNETPGLHDAIQRGFSNLLETKEF